MEGLLGSVMDGLLVAFAFVFLVVFVRIGQYLRVIAVNTRVLAEATARAASERATHHQRLAEAVAERQGQRKRRSERP